MNPAVAFYRRSPKADRADSWIEQALDWPDDAVSAAKHMDGSVSFVTRADIMRQKRERMEWALHWKRQVGVLQRRALCVWVFWCPGMAGFAFRGWWAYLRGVGGMNSSGGGVKENLAGSLLAQVMEMFPVPNPHPLYGGPTPEEWMAGFATHYQRGYHCGKPQGKAFLWADMEGNHVKRLIGPGRMIETRPTMPEEG